MQELPIIQKTYDLILWYVPILNKLPKDHKFAIGDRIVNGLYGLLEQLIIARYAKDKLGLLEPINARLDILRYQTRLLLNLSLIASNCYEYVSKQIIVIFFSIFLSDSAPSLRLWGNIFALLQL